MLRELKSHFVEMATSRHMFEEVMGIVEGNPKTHDPNDFVEWLTLNYVDAAALAVRRQVDDRRDTRSLLRLLRKIRRHPEVVSRDWWLDGHPCPSVGELNFDELVGVGEPHLTGSKVDELTDQVKAAAANVKAHVDKRIAHLARKTPQSAAPATWGDLNLALGELFEAFDTVCMWVDGGSCANLVPVWQYDWKAVFRHPWIPVSDGQTT